MKEATKESLMQDALDHYDEVSTKAGNWYDVIPRAIKFYYTTDVNKIKNKSMMYGFIAGVFAALIVFFLSAL